MSRLRFILSHSNVRIRNAIIAFEINHLRLYHTPYSKMATILVFFCLPCGGVGSNPTAAIYFTPTNNMSTFIPHSAIRACFTSPVSSEAWVRIPPLPFILHQRIIWQLLSHIQGFMCASLSVSLPYTCSES